MAEDWSADIRKYAPNASESVIEAIVRYCGVSLQQRDSALVAFSDPAEVSLVRENFLKKKLGLTDSDTQLDAAVAEVGNRMKADRTKNRVTVYYLLAEHFRKLSLFGGTDEDVHRVAPAVAAGAAVAASATMAGVARPAAAVERIVDPPGATGFAARTAAPPPRSGLMRWLPWLVLAAIVLLLLWWLLSQRKPAVPAVAQAPVAVAPAVIPAAPAVVVAGLPANVFFDTDSATIKPEGTQSIQAAAEAIKKAGSKVAITGYTDRQGDLAHNQDLAKTRAQAVRDALVSAGVPLASIEMRPPMTVEIGASGPDADARRVQITTL